MSGIELVLFDNRGIYIPRDFAEVVRAGTCWSGFNDEDIDILLQGPDHELYWDAWDSVLGSTKFTDSRGRTWYLSQDGDLWIYCEALMTDEEYYNFFGEHRSDLDADSRLETDNWYDTSSELH